VTAIDSLRLSIEGQLREIESEARRLTAALKALEGDGDARARPTPPRARPAGDGPSGGSAAAIRGRGERQRRHRSPKALMAETSEGTRAGEAPTAEKPSKGEVAEAPRAHAVAAPSDSAATVSADVVLAALREGHTKPSAIAQHLGVPVSVVRDLLGELESARRIRRRPRA
jgi:hypothetical protein